MADPAGWSPKQTITISADQVASGGVDDAIVWLHGDQFVPALTSASNATGGNVRVMDAETGGNLLNIHLVAWDKTAGTYAMKVGKPNLSALANTPLYIGTVEAATQPAGGVGSMSELYVSRWKQVSVFNNTLDGAFGADFTDEGESPDLDLDGAASPIGGIACVRTFSGGTRADLRASTLMDVFNDSVVVFAGWFRFREMPDVLGTRSIIDFGSDPSVSVFNFGMLGTSDVVLSAYNANETATGVIEDPPSDDWHFVACHFDNGGNRITLFVDGVAVVEDVEQFGNPNATDLTIRLFNGVGGDAFDFAIQATDSPGETGMTLAEFTGWQATYRRSVVSPTAFATATPLVSASLLTEPRGRPHIGGRRRQHLVRGRLY